jgi:hypothetical protein
MHTQPSFHILVSSFRRENASPFSVLLLLSLSALGGKHLIILEIRQT